MLLFIIKIVIKQKLPRQMSKEKPGKTNKTRFFYFFKESYGQVDPSSNVIKITSDDRKFTPAKVYVTVPVPASPVQA